MDLELEKKLFLNNIKILSFKNLLLSLSYVLVILFMVNKDSPSEEWIIFIVEQFISPIGIILFAKTALIEYETKIYEFAYIKTQPYWRTILSRIIILCVELMAVILIGLFILYFLDGNFNLLKILFGVFVTSFYLGVIGMLSAYIFKQMEVGILISFLYYFFEIFSKGKYTRSLYLFGMISGDYVSKVKLFIISTILVIVCLILIDRET
ncbi:MAG: hypothetical protein AB2375_02450 [Tissierellaceae bacterium]